MVQFHQGPLARQTAVAKLDVCLSGVVSNHLRMAAKSSTHEDYSRKGHEGGSTDRSFGLVFAAFFAIVALWPLRKHEDVRWWAAGVSAAFLLLALNAPSSLKLLNRAWMFLGFTIGKVTNPVITALMFFLIFTPAAILLRLAGKDLLRLKLQPESPSYWIDRTSATPESMIQQF